ncbi:MAG: biopolymer transporter ExbD [Sphingobacteriales bacterium]|nr:biopolymer transporter ExbD [Sphingobacteriales bacterium]
MASIDSGGGDGGHKKGPGVKKAKKLSTRVDMTPMVDLGFLLITFFVFTATMSSPKAMDLRMPKDVKDSTQQNEAKESGALTIMLGKGNQVYYYEGKLDESASNFKSATWKEIRDEIIDKKKRVMEKHQHDYNYPESECKKRQQKAKEDKNPDWQDACLDRDFVVIIKPSQDATYKNTVDILDEMKINQVKTYAMVKIFPQEYELIQATEKNNPNLK